MASPMNEVLDQHEVKEFISEVTGNAHIARSNNDNESQNQSLRGTYVEHISDDQELFLKVLENLKNAVSVRPDNQGTQDLTAEYNHAVKLVNESQHVIPRSDVEEPGTTTITVSDTTKSRILRKLADAGEREKLKSSFYNNLVIDFDETSNSSDKSASSRELIRDNNELLSIKREASDSTQLKGMSFDKSTHKLISKDVNVVRTMFMKKESSEKAQEKFMHIVSPATPSVQLFTCSFCDYYSENKNYLKQHVDFVHTSDRPYKCPHCDYAGKRSHALREHMIVHSSDRPFECKSCNATFRKKGHLTNHIKLHNSKRLVKCPLCKVLVYDAGENGLDSHLKNDHDTERLYGCDLCEHVAANEPDILKHLKETHRSQILSHKCDKCPFETANIADFNAHNTAHNITEGKVNIGDTLPSNVLGVATLPSGTHAFGIPNTSVKIKANEVQGTKQPAVIKPVWIKCSECGFTGQDSEVIKKHMLKHLKQDYYNENYQVEQKTTPKTSAMMSPVVSTASVQHSQKVNVPTSTMKTPILVPVSAVDKLFSSQRGKLDMNSPILVPVTNPSILQSLKSDIMSPYKYSQTKTPTQLVRLSESGTISRVMSPAEPVLTPSSGIHNARPYFISSSTVANTQALSTNLPVTKQAVPVGQLMDVNRIINSQMTSSPKKQLIPVQPHQMEQLMLYPHIKVIPVTEPISTKHVTDTGSTPSKAQQNLAIQQKLVSNNPNLNPIYSVPHLLPVRATMTTTAVSMSTPTKGFRLMQIPVPRHLSAMSAPKLPPEIIQMNTLPIVTEQIPGTSVVKSASEGLNEAPKLATLRESLANVKKLIEQQDKLNKQIGNAPVGKLYTNDMQEKDNGQQKLVYYMAPAASQNSATKPVESAGFTHDSSAGRFRCTLCGYTCEYQRTIKAHIWKHSGHQNIDYPMFQNGPLSIYEDGQHPMVEIENVAEPAFVAEKINTPVSTSPGFKVIREVTTDDVIKSTDPPSSKNPPFIVYEQTKISNVAPALAQLIAARTMVGLTEPDNTKTEPLSCKPATSKPTTLEDSEKQNSVNTEDHITAMETPDQNTPIKVEIQDIDHNSDKEQQMASPEASKTETVTKKKPNVNVVVESVQGVQSSDFTGMQSQQNSPRIMVPKSPDSGVTEATSMSTTIADDRSTSSGFISPGPSQEMGSDYDDSGIRRSKRRLMSLEHNKKAVDISESDGVSSSKKMKVTESREDSAVTLLSLLKKGPNFNPACPPRTSQGTPVNEFPGYTQMSETPSPTQEDSNSGDMESETGSTKPKSGISTSLLAVIEQLRERSKSDIDEDKQIVSINITNSKKPSKRRSRKSSVEDNTPATGIENVEEFVSEGEVKFRCSLCHYTNDSTLLLRQHMRLHKPKQEFECSLCDLIAESSESLQDHMIQHCKIRTYQCKLCTSAFNYKSQLRAHMRMHNDQDILMCDFCDFETRSSSALKVHTKSHLTKAPYKCELCDEEFITSYNLRVHKREGCYTSVDKAGMFKCDECEYITVNRREMKNHQKSHLGKSCVPSPKKCPYCEHLAPSVDQIQLHIAEAHGESKPLKCDMCGFVAVSIRSLKSHMKRHVNDQRFVQQPLEQYKCNLCGYVCHHLPSLKSHMWRHAADQHYSYEFTNDVINAAIDFDGHTDTVETTQDHVEHFRTFIYEKMKSKGLENTRQTQEESAVACCWVTFRCCQCGFETINKADLNMHMAAHSDVIKWTLDVTDEERNKT